MEDVEPNPAQLDQLEGRILKNDGTVRSSRQIAGAETGGSRMINFQRFKDSGPDGGCELSSIVRGVKSRNAKM